MALAELSMLEQRYLAVREVLDTGATVTDVAARHGVDRRTLHRWHVRWGTAESVAGSSGLPSVCRSSRRSKHIINAPFSADHLARIGRCTGQNADRRRIISARHAISEYCGRTFTES
jgi:hypothetical protein